VDDDGDGKDDHFVFGELTNNTLDFTTRANVIFTPTLSLQLYMQSFVTVGEYRNFKELARPESYEFIPYPHIDFNPDFHNRSLRSNVVLRHFGQRYLKTLPVRLTFSLLVATN